MTTLESQIRLKTEKLDNVEAWYWPISDTGLWKGPSEEWPLFKELVLKYTRKFDVVVCAGGACGMYPRLYANMFKNVYTFEPDFINFFCLSVNTQLPNVYKFNASLGDNHTWISMNRSSPDNLGMHTVGGSGPIPMMTIDSFNFYA